MLKKRVKEKEQISQAIRGLIKAYRTHGMKKIMSKIDELYASGTPPDMVKKKIIAEVVFFYNIPWPTIKESNKRGEVTHAKITTIILFHKHLNWSQATIAEYFARDPSLISRLVKDFYSNNPGEKVYYNSEFLSTFNKIDQKIISYKNQVK